MSVCVFKQRLQRLTSSLLADTAEASVNKDRIDCHTGESTASFDWQGVRKQETCELS